MYGFFTFIHINGMIIWLGSLFSVTIVLFMLKKHLDTDIARELARKLIRTFNTITYPASVIVFISGVYRLVQKDFSGAANSLWLNYMEIVGIMIVPLNILLLAILGRRVTNLLLLKQAKTTIIELRLSEYLSAVLLIMFAMLSIILMVSLRI